MEEIRSETSQARTEALLRRVTEVSLSESAKAAGIVRKESACSHSATSASPDSSEKRSATRMVRITTRESQRTHTHQTYTHAAHAQLMLTDSRSPQSRTLCRITTISNHKPSFFMRSCSSVSTITWFVNETLGDTVLTFVAATFARSTLPCRASLFLSQLRPSPSALPPPFAGGSRREHPLLPPIILAILRHGARGALCPRLRAAYGHLSNPHTAPIAARCPHPTLAEGREDR